MAAAPIVVGRRHHRRELVGPLATKRECSNWSKSMDPLLLSPLHQNEAHPHVRAANLPGLRSREKRTTDRYLAGGSEKAGKKRHLIRFRVLSEANSLIQRSDPPDFVVHGA
jgi:hypothetical protein